MKRNLLTLFIALLSISSFAQDDCFTRLQKAFNDRGAYTVSDDMHRNVIITYFLPGGGTTCVSGKARVENGHIESIFLQFDDNSFEFMEKKFYNAKKTPPIIVNGISEMIYNADGEKFKVVFIESLKPKKKNYKSANIPLDL